MKAHAALAGHVPPPAAARASAICPRCGSPVDRIPRHGLDRLVSLVVPLRRYRCRTFTCDWEGALRAPLEVSARYGQDHRRPYL